MAGLDQSGGHGLAHAAEANPADIVRCFASHAKGTSLQNVVRCEFHRSLG
jgi:hypothetical protein